MISQSAAIRITSDNFPNGPTTLANHLGVEVQYSPLVGVEGWCVRGKKTIVRINSSSSPFRQRFTLAHELAHLVLRTEPDIATEPFRSNVQEERDADQLASEFLIPQNQLQTHLRGQLPVDAKTLGRLAKAANVSPVMAACRVVNATNELGLQNAAVVFFVGGSEQWRYSQGLRFDKDEAKQLFQMAMDSKPDVVRDDNKDGNVVVGSIIDAQAYQVLFIQLLPTNTASQKTYEERIRGLTDELFGDDHSFRQSVAGSMGTVKNKCSGQSLDDAVKFFFSNYPDVKYVGNKARKLKSQMGRDYVRLYLERWFK